MALCWILEEVLFKLGSSCWQLGKDGVSWLNMFMGGLGSTELVQPWGGGGGSMWRLQVWHLNVYDTTCHNLVQYRLHVLRDFEIFVVFGWAFVGLEHGC